jgi:hypothetical protein
MSRRGFLPSWCSRCERISPDGSIRERGLHAAAVTGYSLPPAGKGYGTGPIARFSFGKMDKLYVHDDQVGPHARMQIVNSGQADWRLTTSWGLHQSSGIGAHPIAVLPLYNKIRIPYKPPLEDAPHFAAGLDALASVVPALANLRWDFRLTTLNQFRGELLGSSAVSGPTRRELLTLALPAFFGERPPRTQTRSWSTSSSMRRTSRQVGTCAGSSSTTRNWTQSSGT